MMGQNQIVRRKKKKGRPSKADLARRSGDSQAPSQPDLRRSRRRRNVRYNIDYDDYIDEEEDDEEEEDERRREKKKLKLMVKLNNHEEEEEEEDNAPTRTLTRGVHASEENGEEEEEDEDDDEEEGNEEVEEHEEEVQVKGRKVDSKGLHSVSVLATPSKFPPGIPLPDKRTMELILDKLQKKDTYGVYAEPVDPEELPDYHDVIERPMDFATVRKKLANGSYSTLEQFENDVFLICSNAMQYNEAETIYHKQARSIQELARKKFEKLRIDYERSQSELKSEQKTRSNSLVRKQAKKPLVYASQEPVGSDFSSGATLATIGDVLPTSNPIQGVLCDRPSNIDGSLVEGNAFLIDANQEKAEDYILGRGLLSKLGRKSSVQDIERRATYNMSNLPVSRSDSIFATFEGEVKQLVTVGLQAEYSYARSLARFAATLGPSAWKIASQKIQQALPPGCKFGRGWVGEYEPLPTPVLMLDNRAQQLPSLVIKAQSTNELIKVDKNCTNVESSMEHHFNGPMHDGKLPSVCSISGPKSDGKSSLFGSAGPRPNSHANLFHQQPNVQTRRLNKSESKRLKQVELNSLPLSDQNNASLVAKLTSSTPAAPAVSKPREMVPSNMNILPSMPFKQPDTNGVASGEMSNRKVRNPSLSRRMIGPSSESTSNQTSRAAPIVLAHGQDQSLSDPVQLMRMLAEKTQKQQTSSSSNHSPADTPPVTLSVPSVRREDLSNASAAAARAWMSVGAAGFKQGPENSSSPKTQISADSLYNPAREFHQPFSRIRGESPSSGMPFPSEKNNFPFQALVPQPMHPVGVSQIPSRPMFFPQVAASDLSRFQIPAWRGIRSPNQMRQTQETLPPDLNIGFQTPGSPATQSSGVLVDSQQPDLALQL